MAGGAGLVDGRSRILAFRFRKMGVSGSHPSSYWYASIRGLTLLAISVPELEGGAYTVVDPLNVTSVPPVGRLLLHPLDSKPMEN